MCELNGVIFKYANFYLLDIFSAHNLHAFCSNFDYQCICVQNLDALYTNFDNQKYQQNK